MTTLFDTVLVANRGEIAVRITRTLRSLGIRSVVVFSDADADARHVREADEAILIGPASPRESYLSIERIIDAARRAGADALHPGYGFLSESALLARACADAGVTFIGPPPGAIEAMGDKIRARDTVAAAGVPVVPGRGAPGMSDDELVAAALEVGLPVLLKPSAGGGGKGMRVIEDVADLAPSIAASRREALASFADDTMLVERFVTRPRHIEVQVVADEHGNVVHFGERECSLQRRHQKIVEESPSPFVTEAVRQSLGEQAIAVAKACGYTNVGTVELIVSSDRPDDFFFMEMNTRLQVEHPVTEEVYGVDLVELQVRIAAGERLPWAQQDVRPRRHAVEARVYAEDPAHDFVPTGGTVLAVREATGVGVRVDSALQDGLVVGMSYDPMLAKVIATGETRHEAIVRLRQALARTSVLGISTNIGYLQDLLAQPEVLAGDIDTAFVERADIAPVGPPDEVLVAAWLHDVVAVSQPNPWASTTAWRLGGSAWIAGELDVGGQRRRVRARRDGQAWTVAVDDGEPRPMNVVAEGDHRLVVTADGRVSVLDVALAPTGERWLGVGGRAWAVTTVDRRASSAAAAGASGDGTVTSPMPGTVVAVLVGDGDAVEEGQSLAVIEAMKMEHTLRAPFDGVVSAVHVAAGDQVAIGHAVVTVANTIEEE